LVFAKTGLMSTERLQRPRVQLLPQPQHLLRVAGRQVRDVERVMAARVRTARLAEAARLSAEVTRRAPLS